MSWVSPKHFLCYKHTGVSLWSAHIPMHVAWGRNTGNYRSVAGMWWNGSCDWSAAMQAYNIFRKNREGRWGGRSDLNVREQLKCVQLCLGMKDQLAGSFCVRIEKLPDEEEEVDKTFYRKLEGSSHLQVLVLIEVFNCPESAGTGYKQSWRALVTTSWPKWQRNQSGKVLCCTSYSQIRKGLLGMRKSKAALAAISMK